MLTLPPPSPVPQEMPPKEPRQSQENNGCLTLLAILGVACFAMVAFVLMFSPPTSENIKEGPRTQPMPTASPSKPKAWTVIKEWEGNGTKNTEKFTVSDEWCIEWSTTPGEFGGLNFQIFVNGGVFPDVAANVIGAGKDVSYQHEAGTYWLTINTAQPYKVRVLENR